MTGSRDDLREALARDLTRAAASIESSRTGLGVNGGLVSALGRLTFQNLPLILDALAQVSALQAEVERLQKVEGERGRLERDPCGSGSRPSDQAPAGLAPSGFDPSRDAPPTHISIEGIEGLLRRLAKHTDTETQDRALFAGAGVRLREYRSEAQQIIADTRGRWEAFSKLDCDSDPSIDPLAGYSIEWLVGWWRNGAQEADLNIHVGSGKNAERQARSMAGSLNYLLSMQNAPAEPAPCDRSGEADETRRGSAEGESTVTGVARQAPSGNPLTETKEGSEHV